MTNTNKGHGSVVLFLLMLSGLQNLQAQEMSAAEAAKEFANPARSLASLANRMVYTQSQGDLPNAGNQDSWSYQFQPVLPFPVGDKGNRIIFRPQFTVALNQPVFDGATGDFDSLDEAHQSTTPRLAT